MCEKTSVLIIFLIIKILTLILIPALIIFLKFRKQEEKSKLINVLFIINVVLLLILIILKVTNSSCVINSSIGTIKRLDGIDKATTRLVDSQDQKELYYIIPEVETSINDKKILYYNNAILPLSNKTISCNRYNAYMKNYGSSITALASLISTELVDIVNPIDILDIVLKNNLFDCDKGVDFNQLINLVQSNYKIRIKEIDSSEIEKYTSLGIPVLENIKYNSSVEKNLTCNENFIIIYKKSNGNNFNVINGNRRSNLADYICSETTPGKYDVIKQEYSDVTYTLDELKQIGIRYYIAEGVN